MSLLMDMFNASDADGDGLLNLTEVESLMEAIEEHDGHGDMYWVCYDMSTHEIHMDIHDEHDCEDAGFMWVGMEMDEEEDHNLGFAKLHIEEEGDYGFALPMGTEMFILMDEDAHAGHDDHSGHSDHDDHSGHSDHDDHSDEDDHDDHGDEEEIEAGEGEEAFEYDPHSWLDPLAYKAQINGVLELLVVEFPEGEDTFRANAKAYIAQLEELHVSFDTAFSESGVCHGKSVVANHNAYAYMGQRYEIDFLTVHGLDPEGEPSAADIAEVVEHIKEEGITVLFVEEYTDQSSVDSIVQETGVTVKILYTMELPPMNSDDDYISLMYKNLDNLKAGMNC
ncbi:MAG: High-affinity zinc uptake system binding-protein ZnuA [Methanobacteriota archaeon]|nr:MAG: High-affinity zinc uptake system binding-protein ZnuA [Euryarchaeota archaeon]